MKIYEQPILEVEALVSSDVITTSGGDTQYDDMEWGQP